MTAIGLTPGQTNCPNCNTKIYMYNQHVCAECGQQTCPYCETDHANTHKEEENARTDTGTTGGSGNSSN